MKYFYYDETALDHLKNKDAKLKVAIEKIGYIEREINTEPFSSLIQQIISQQISAQGAATVYNRLEEKVAEMNAKNIYDLGVNNIQSCGMSFRKATYIHKISAAVINDDLNFDQLTTMDDEAVIAKMSELDGIGKWSAQMFLIFTMQRMNVIAYDDLAIRKGMMKLYNLKKLDKKIFERHKKKYEPYATVASIYLWHLAHNDLEE